MIRGKYREWGDWDEPSATHLSLPLVSSFLVFSNLGNSVKGDKRKAKWQIGEEIKVWRETEKPLQIEPYSVGFKQLSEYCLLIGQKNPFVLFCPIGGQQIHHPPCVFLYEVTHV